MASISIRQAVKTVHLQQHKQGLWRLDSPTEAALVAGMCNRQSGEVVISSVGDPQPEDPDKYFLANQAPSSFHGTDKMRHAYVLGQHAQYAAYQLAQRRGLLPTNAVPGQQQEQQQPEQGQPCSPTAAAVQDSTCKTPVSQLRAEHQQVEDSSLSNNIVRRLAVDIQTDSPALQATLAEYSMVRRSTASFRSRVSTHSECSFEGTTTPLASPGRGWASPPAAASRTGSQGGSSSGHFPTPSQGGAASGAACSAVQEPSQLQLHMQSLGLGSSWERGGHSPLLSPLRQHSAAHEPAVPQQGLPAAAVPSLCFSGFAAAGSKQRSLDSAAGSLQLETPRLEQHWAPFSNNSSSNGTTVSLDHLSSSNGCATQWVQPHNSGLPCTAANDDRNEPPPAGVAQAGGLRHAADSGVGEDIAAIGSFTGQTGTVAAYAADPCENAANRGASGQSVASAYVEGAFDSPSSSRAAGLEGALQQAASWPDILGLQRADSPGYWSCDEEGATEAAADGTAGQSAACGTPLAAAASTDAVLAQPCQLPLSPMLLKELSKQLSFQEGAEGAPACPACGDDDATTCCDDWATVYSYEQLE